MCPRCTRGRLFRDLEDEDMVCLSCGHRIPKRPPPDFLDPQVMFDDGQYRLPDPVFTYRNPEEKYVASDARKRRRA